MDNNFVNSIVPKQGQRDFIVVDLNFKVNEFAEFLMSKKEFVDQNNGWMRIQVLKTKSDPNKYYAKFNDFKPTQTKAADHSPDREDSSDLPF